MEPKNIQRDEFLRILEKAVKYHCKDSERPLSGWFLALGDIAKKEFNKAYAIDFPPPRKDAP